MKKITNIIKNIIPNNIETKGIKLDLETHFPFCTEPFLHWDPSHTPHSSPSLRFVKCLVLQSFSLFESVKSILFNSSIVKINNIIDKIKNIKLKVYEFISFIYKK
jgi:hypothetical protein